MDALIIDIRRKDMLPIMFQLYNVRNELGKDFDGTLNEVAKIGYKYVELAIAPHFGKTASEFKASLEKAGLKAISAHVPYEDLIADADAAISFHRELGCEFIVIPYLSDDNRSTGPYYEDVKKNFARLAEEVKKSGAVLLYHNHEFEFEMYKGKHALDDLYDSVPADLLQTQIDVCWTKVGGVDPIEYILKYSGRAPLIHLKDFDSSAGNVKASYDLIGQAAKARDDGIFPYRELGKGTMDIPGIIKAAEKAGTKWLVVEQDDPTPGKTPLECAKVSLDYLNGLKL